MSKETTGTDKSKRQETAAVGAEQSSEPLQAVVGGSNIDSRRLLDMDKVEAVLRAAEAELARREGFSNAGGY